MSFIAQETTDKKGKQALYKWQLKNVNDLLSAYKTLHFTAGTKELKIDKLSSTN